MRRVLALAAPLALAAFIGCSSDDEPGLVQTPGADAGGVDARVEADAGTDAKAAIDADAGPNTEAGIDAAPLAIGATGGAVESADGKAQLVVPPNAFATDLKIVIAPSTKPVDDKIVSKAYEITPNDTTFARDLDLCLETTSSVKTQDACLAYFDEKTTKWKCEDTCLTRKGDDSPKLCGHTDHFTSFAILLSGSSATEAGSCGSDLVAPNGGAVVGPKGEAAVTFPAGALTKPTRVTVTKIPPPATADFGSSVYELRANDTTSFGADVELCIKPEAGKDLAGACLGYFDETNKKWKCEDPCLSAKGKDNDGLYCGKTDHFTSFAILLSGSSDSSVASASCIGGRVPPGGATLVSLDAVATYAVADGAFTKPTRVTLARAPSEKGLASDVFQVLSNDALAKPSTICLTPNPGVALDKGCLGTKDGTGGWSCVAPCLQRVGARLCAPAATLGYFALLPDGGSGSICPK